MTKVPWSVVENSMHDTCSDDSYLGWDVLTPRSSTIDAADQHRGADLWHSAINSYPEVKQAYSTLHWFINGYLRKGLDSKIDTLLGTTTSAEWEQKVDTLVGCRRGPLVCCCSVAVDVLVQWCGCQTGMRFLQMAV